MKNKVWLFLFVVSSCAVNSAYGQKSKLYSEADDKVYNQIQQVKGKVIILNHPDLGKTPGSGQYLVFQRNGCKDCLVATYADGEGNYKLYLGVGKYKLIVQFKNCGYAPTEDCAGDNYLSANQPQYLTVERGPSGGPEFNIELVLPKR